MITDQKLREFRSALAAATIPANDPSLKYEFRQGWNGGVELAENLANKFFGKAERDGAS